MFISSLKLVLSDKGFDVPSVLSQKVRVIADKMLIAIEEDQNQECVLFFLCWLFKEIQACCTHPRALTCHAFKEHMWEKYYKLNAKDAFRKEWTLFVHTLTGFNANPIFYGFVTKSIFEQLVKYQLPTEPRGLNGLSQPKLDSMKRTHFDTVGVISLDLL